MSRSGGRRLNAGEGVLPMWDEPDGSRRRKKRKKQRFRRDDDSPHSRRPRYRDDFDWDDDADDEPMSETLGDDDDLDFAAGLGDYADRDGLGDWEEHGDWDEEEEVDPDRE